MDKAKQAIGDFMHKSGKHDTTVHETVSPAVQHETVKPHHHEQLHTAVDKEVHQDHYHRTVQPVKDREVLPEQHHHNLGAVQHKEFDHRDHEGTKNTLATDQAHFRDKQVVEDTTHSQTANPTVGGEHVHHHIHETIQPVVHKETVQPHVTHTTVPIHEVHHNKATHHDSTSLPTMSMDEFKGKGGVLGGREERYDGFEGEPKHFGGTLSNLAKGSAKRDSAHVDDATRKGAMHGDYPAGGQHHHGGHQTRTGEMTGNEYGTGAGVGATTAAANKLGGTDATRSHGSSGAYAEPNASRESDLNRSTNTANSKPSMMKKLNPFADADGDGKKGMMD